jgi:hypothetical protein
MLTRFAYLKAGNSDCFSGRQRCAFRSGKTRDRGETMSIDFKDPANRLTSVKSTHYNAAGDTIGLVIETADGAARPLVMSESDVQRLIEMLLSLAKEAANAPNVQPPKLKGWVGAPIEVDRVSLLNLTTPRHAVLGFGFGRLMLGIKTPKLILGRMISEAAAAIGHPSSETPPN